jgi:hypothetical protein
MTNDLIKMFMHTVYGTLHRVSQQLGFARVDFFK